MRPMPRILSKTHSGVNPQNSEAMFVSVSLITQHTRLANTCSYYNDVTYSNKPRPSVGLEMLWLEQRRGVVQQHPPLEDLISSSTHTLAVPGRVDTELQVNTNLWFVPIIFHALCLLPFLCVVYYLSYLEHSLLVLNNYFLGCDTKIYHQYLQLNFQFILCWLSKIKR